MPSYATLTQATVSLVDMGDKTITAKIAIDGDIVPDFSSDWWIVFRGEKYIMPLREPQGVKDNESLCATYDFTFQHWAIYWLKQKFFFDYVSTNAGQVMFDKLIVPLQLNLADFCDYLSNVCKYWFDYKITVDFNAEGWKHSLDKLPIEISNSTIWDVLSKLYETYAVRWSIEPLGGVDRYVIRIGYGSDEVSHILRYGFEGGLLKIERQVQDENIRNILYGRGGSKNLPYRYFKKFDENNKGFSRDPDWLPQLADIPFTELRGATFRSYVQGWKQRHKEELLAQYPYDYEEHMFTVDKADKAYAPWAWLRGYNDEKFDPTDFVADAYAASGNGRAVLPGSSIARYGELMGALDNNEEIYPTIQGIELDGVGRVNECVFAERPVTDDYKGDDLRELGQSSVSGVTGPTVTIPKNGGVHEFVLSPHGSSVRDFFINDDKIKGIIDIPEGTHGNLYLGSVSLNATFEKTTVKLVAEPGNGWDGKSTLQFKQVTEDIDFDHKELLVVQEVTGKAVNLADGTEHPLSGIPPGKWTYEIHIKVQNTYAKKDLKVTPQVSQSRYHYAGDDPFALTFDVWIKNVWDSSHTPGESDEHYVQRIWGPILGNSEGEEAKLLFVSGALAASEDYEFKIVKGGVHFDDSRTIYRFRDGTVASSLDDANLHGGVDVSYKSEWRLTLQKSDADLESTGKYIPSTQRFAVTGDLFVFLGIDLPHMYVVEAEKRLDNWKKDELAKKCNIRPTYVARLDNVRIHNSGNPGAIVDSLRIGNSVRLADPRLVNGDYELLYIQSVTYNYKEPTDKEANIIPDVEIVLSDSYETSVNPVSMLTSEVSSLQRQLGSLSNIEQAVRNVADMLYLRKDGIEEESASPTKFKAPISSGNFRSGLIGGAGWGFYIDDNGACVLETDRLAVRQDMEVNNLVINQVSARSGMIVESAAQMAVTEVEEDKDSYICYFDQKLGSVGNLFQVDDIAFCQRFTPENAQMKYYRRRITETGLNFIRLTKGYTAVTLPGNRTDTGVRGAGVPEQGDVIIQYGNYSDPKRRFVKVRDVVGGGYDRYIMGLDCVNEDGTEYYFSGRQTGSYGDKPRFFIGDTKEYLEWINGKLNIRGSISVSSTIGDSSIEEYIKQIAPGYNDEELRKKIADLDYLKAAIQDTTSITGGLVLTKLIKLGDNNQGIDKQTTYSGISGIFYKDLKGRSIAAWYGGDMIDREVEGNADNPKRARSLFRMDGTGYLSDGQLSWDLAGTLTLGNGVKIAGLADSISESITSFINFTQGLYRMFVPETADGSALEWGDLANKDGLARVDRIRVNRSLYSVGGMAALGYSPDISGGGSGGGGGISYGRLDEWDDYDPDSGYVLSAKLGVELKDRIASLVTDGVVTVSGAQSITGLKSFTNQLQIRSNIAFCHPDTTSGVYVTGDAGGGLAFNAHRDWSFTAGLASLSATGRFSAKRLRSEAAQGTAPIEVSSTTLCANLNADMVDGLHSVSFARADASPSADLDKVNGRGIMTNDANGNATEDRHYPINEAGVLIYGDAAYGSACQIYGTYMSNRWFARGGGGADGKTKWREFAFTDSTVAVAKKLEKTITVWGKTTDGTNNIDGHMSGVADINTAASPARVVYLGAEHNGNAWNNGKGVVNISITNNDGQTPLILAYREGTSNMAGTNRLFAMELRDDGSWMQLAFGGESKYTLDNKGNFYAEGGVTCLSDMLYKNVIHNLDLPIKRIAKAPMFVYNWISDPHGDESVGSSAQYWQRFLPWLVKEHEGVKTLDYGRLGALIGIADAREIVRLSNDNKRLKEDNKQLKEDNKKLRKRMDALEKKLNKLIGG